MDEAEYWLTHTPTVDEIRRLNRDTLYVFPLAVLIALMDAGFDLEAIGNAVLKQVIVETSQLVDARLRVFDGDRLLAELAETTDGFTYRLSKSERQRRIACGQHSKTA